MNSYSLDVDTNIVGGYFSSEQIDLLSIIQCNSIDELIDFITNCEQLKYDKTEMLALMELDFESAKRKVFKTYQESLIPHDSARTSVIINTLRHCGINEEDIMTIINILAGNPYENMAKLKEYIKNKYPDNYEAILTMQHRFVALERDQNKAPSLYEEMTFLNSQLPTFNSLLIGSGRIYDVVNNLFDEKEKRFDFYHAKRDLDFAYKNGKQVRYHSLLVKEKYDALFAGKSKTEILSIISVYVKESIDFITEYNRHHQVNVNGQIVPIINAVDLFNEIVSFEKNDKGEYYNIWESRYGITMAELLSAFDYAFQNKPAGVSFVYNEPFLEDDDRRKKVLATLSEIDSLKPGLIDTLGSQMHITITEPEDKIKRSFEDFRKLQITKGKKIQITEFDMSLGRSEASRVFGNDSDITLEEVYAYKKQKVKNISDIIALSGVKLDGISYWSLTDGIDSNLERVRTQFLKNGQIKKNDELPTVCGGLFPTRQYLSRIVSPEIDNLGQVIKQR